MHCASNVIGYQKKNQVHVSLHSCIACTSKNESYFLWQQNKTYHLIYLQDHTFSIEWISDLCITQRGGISVVNPWNGKLVNHTSVQCTFVFFKWVLFCQVLVLKVSQFRMQILKFSFEPKNEQKYVSISALAS